MMSSSVGKGTKPGRQNIYFVPIENTDICRKSATEVQDYARQHGCNPLFIHQNFDSETISDWNNDLIIILFYHETSLHLLLMIFGTLSVGDKKDAEYEKARRKLVTKLSTGIGVISNENNDTVQEVYRGMIMEDIDAYEGAVRRYHALPVSGELVSCITLPSVGAKRSVVEIYEQKFSKESSLLEPSPIPTMTETNPLGESFQGFHRRFEYIMHFFIESCSAILRHPCWTIYTAFQYDLDKTDPVIKDEWLKQIGESETLPQRPRRSSRTRSTEEALPSGPMSGGKAVAFVSVYKYPGLIKRRCKISQFFTLPNFQGQGLASVLLKHIFVEVQSDPNICELSVEDPALAFKQIRDVIGLEVALNTGVFPVHVLRPSDPLTHTCDSNTDSPPFGKIEDIQKRELQRPDSRYMNFIETLKKPKVNKLFGGGYNLGANSLLGQSDTSAASNSILEKLQKSGDISKSLESLKYISGYLQHLYDICRFVIKESEGQCERLVEILLLAKYLPEDAFLELSTKREPITLVEPPAKRLKSGGGELVSTGLTSEPIALVDQELSRSYRVCSHVTEELVKKWARDARIEPVRLFVKMRILSEMDVEVAGGDRKLTHEEMITARNNNNTIESLDNTVKIEIENEWHKTAYSYMRTLHKLRKMIQIDSVKGN